MTDASDEVNDDVQAGGPAMTPEEVWELIRTQWSAETFHNFGLTVRDMIIEACAERILTEPRADLPENKEDLVTLLSSDFEEALIDECAAMAVSDVNPSTWPVDYEALDPGVRNLVRWLVSNGFATTDSGDGVSKAELIRDGYAENVPHVYMLVAKERMFSEAERLLSSLSKISDVMPMIDASYNPVDKVCILALHGINDGSGKFAPATEES